MILDEQNLFSDNQTLVQSCASTNVLDFGKREIAYGTPVELYIQIAEDFDNLTNLKISLQTAVDEDFSTPVTLIEHVMLLSELKKGAVSNIKFLPKGNLGFVRLYYTITGTAPTKGKIFAGITDSALESFHTV